MSKRTTSKKKKHPSKQVQAAVQSLVANLLSGTAQSITVPINLTLPSDLYNVYSAAAEQYGVPINTLLEQAAKQGIDIAMSFQKQQPMIQQPVASIPNQLGFDSSGLSDGLGKLQEVAQQLGVLQKALDERLNPKDIG